MPGLRVRIWCWVSGLAIRGMGDIPYIVPIYLGRSPAFVNALYFRKISRFND
jgi:hypothetical protein